MPKSQNIFPDTSTLTHDMGETSQLLWVLGHTHKTPDRGSRKKESQEGAS